MGIHCHPRDPNIWLDPKLLMAFFKENYFKYISNTGIFQISYFRFQTLGKKIVLRSILPVHQFFNEIFLKSENKNAYSLTNPILFNMWQ